ncbi:4'-phosphopantetheinyl transferase [Halomonas shantousis]
MTPRPSPICHPFEDRCPLPVRLATTQWIATRFDATCMTPQAFADCAIVPPAKLLTAATKRQAEFLAGRLCAREAIQRLTGERHVPGVGEDRAPRWPAGVVGSITHGGALAAAIVGAAYRYRGLGMDAESHLSTERAHRLAVQILTPREREHMAHLPEAQHGPFVTRVFSFKESLFKALYPLVKVRFYFQDAELDDECPDTAQVRLRLLTSLSPQWPAGTRLDGQYADDGERVLTLVAIVHEPR